MAFFGLNVGKWDEAVHLRYTTETLEVNAKTFAHIKSRTKGIKIAQCNSHEKLNTRKNQLKDLTQQ